MAVLTWGLGWTYHDVISITQCHAAIDSIQLKLVVVFFSPKKELVGTWSCANERDISVELRYGVSTALFEAWWKKGCPGCCRMVSLFCFVACKSSRSGQCTFQHKWYNFRKFTMNLRNADGFGVGWYAQQAPLPCVFTSLKPALWICNQKLRSYCKRMFFVYRTSEGLGWKVVEIYACFQAPNPAAYSLRHGTIPTFATCRMRCHRCRF